MRRMVQGAVALTFGFLAFGSNASDDARFGVQPATADPSASDCVRFSKSDLDKGLEFSVQSSCEHKLSCSLSWNVVCEDTEGKVTSRAKASRRFALALDDDLTILGSAETCKQSWRIDNVGWNCQPVK